MTSMFEDDPFGSVRKPIGKSGPSPKEVLDFHSQADVDSSAFAMHHTLGVQHHQASYGDHDHNGKNSSLISIPSAQAVIFGTGIGQIQFVMKAGNTDRSSVGTATDDPDLTVPVLANGVYVWDAGIHYTHGGTGTLAAFDMTYGWTIPSGANNDWPDNRVDQAVTTAVAVIRGFRDQGTGTPTTGIRDNAGVAFDSLTTLDLHGILVCGGNAGNFTFKWAQSVSTASPALRVAQRSWLKVQRMA